MRIGIDFDNTIACYEGVFHKAALARGLIPETIGTSKNAVRDHLNGSGQKDAFTELQGYVYGARMDLVDPYPGLAEFVRAASAAGHELFVVSHKTKEPMKGPAYDLHAAARGFLEAQGLIGEAGFPAGNVFFELTKEEKVARAKAIGVDVFVDDLPEILAMEGFPPAARLILFDPHGNHGEDREAEPFERHEDWRAIAGVLIG